MCGRFTLRTPTNVIVQQFRVQTDLQLPLRFNIAPTQTVATVRAAEGGRELWLPRWGLIPSWAKDRKIASSLINARAETIATKPAFRAAFKRRRCLVVTDGFYEWQKSGKQKLPFHIRLADDQPFAFAGLWETWTDEQGKPLDTCTIITTTANELTRPLHDRMPVILDDTDYDLWLDPAVQDASRLEPLLHPYPSNRMVSVPVSTRVNSVRNDDPTLLLAT